MLSSIHPLGERARHNRWAVTVTAFTAGAVLSGAAAGLVLGSLGALTLGSWGNGVPAIATAVAALAAGGLDIARVRPPGPHRQVNETWIGAFRGWIYGGGFGLELGLGVLTYVVTWGVYAMFVSALLTGSPAAGALVGAVFGFGRSLSLLAAGFIDRPSRLTSFNRRLALIGPSMHRMSSVALALSGVAILAGGLL